MTMRKRYLAEFQSKVALEAIREELATAELAGHTASIPRGSVDEREW